MTKEDDTIKLLAKAVKFRFSDDVFVESRGSTGWAVTNGNVCWNTFGEWEYEPFPSSRTDDFIERTRFSLEEATAVAEWLVAPDVPGNQ